MIRRSSFAAALVLAIAWLAAPRQAAAYPQFQFSSGTTRCGQCHYSPSGGTLITFDYDELGFLRSAANAGSTFSYERDPAGRVLAETVNGRTLRYGYDVLGNCVNTM